MLKIFGPLYRRVLGWAAHRHAPRYLGALSFAESSFFPIPVDVMLAPMVLANRDKWIRYASIATLFSVPFIVLTLGLFFLIINGAMLILASLVLDGLAVQGCMPAILGGLVLAAFNWVVRAFGES